MSAALQRVQDALPRFTESGRHRFIAPCPAHNDDRPSLHFRETEDGAVALKCLAGCPQRAVLLALGLTRADLSADGTMSRPTGPVLAAPPPPSRMTNRWGLGTDPIPGANRRGVMRTAVHVASYRYTDVEDRLVGVVDRFETFASDGTRLDKYFRPRLVWPSAAPRWPADAPGWRYTPAPFVLPLYRLPDLLHRPEGAVVFLVEGEKDVETLVARGFTATTAPGGATGWNLAHTLQLLRVTSPGDAVALCPDRDAAGAVWRATLVRHLGGKGRRLQEWAA